jgi:ABC-type phosphate/phosphonate transport system substrate-binding protein
LFAFDGRAFGEEKPADNNKAPNKDEVVIGMPKSLFQGIPIWMVELGAEPFLKLMKESTAVNGKILHVSDAMTLADQMDVRKVQIGVFQGHEFAWVKKKYPDLIPIALSAPMNPVQTFCVVRWDCKAANIGELKDQKLSLPAVHRDFCDMYLAKQKDEHMKGKDFAGVIKAATATEAIFNVIQKECGCAVIDCSTYEFFKSVYPGQFKNLKVLCHSEVFPNACVAVKKGVLEEKTIEKFRHALLHARELPGGEAMLLNFKLNGFVKVPDDYEKLLKDLQKGYPAPAALRPTLQK